MWGALAALAAVSMLGAVDTTNCAAELSARGVFASPVQQSGPRSSVSGSLGEPWVGRATGTRLTVDAGFRRRVDAGTEAVQVTLLSPNGAESIGTGSPVEIRWRRDGGSGEATVDLAWSSNGGVDWTTIATNLRHEVPGPGSFDWVAPGSPVPAVLLRVTVRTVGAITLDVSDAPFTVIDDDAPILTLGVLANPYVGRFIDLFAVADEPLSGATMRFEVGGVSLSPTQVDDDGRVFWLDFQFEGPVDSLGLSACAQDIAGNLACATGSLAARQIGAAGGGSLWSSDRSLRVTVPEGALAESWLVIATLDAPGGPEGAESSAPPRYVVLPETPPSAELMLHLPGPRLAAGASPEFALMGPDGPIEAWFDREANVAHASVSRLGEISLVSGQPGSWREVDPSLVELVSVAPNPFSSHATVHFTIGQSQPVTLSVLDVSGRRVARLIDGMQVAPGRHVVTWDGRSDAGREVATGIYFLHLRSNRGESTLRSVRVP